MVHFCYEISLEVLALRSYFLAKKVRILLVIPNFLVKLKAFF